MITQMIHRADPSTRRPWWPALATILGMFALTTPGLAQDDEVDRRVQRKIDRLVLSDDFGHVVPCEDLETEHPDAVRRSQRGYLGVELTALTEDLLRHFGVPDDGVMVSRVTGGSPADRSGLRVGDIVSRFDGRSIDSTLDLGRAVRELPGDTVVAEVWRDGTMQNISVSVGQRDMCSFDLGAFMEDLDFRFDFDDLAFDAEELGRIAAELGARGAEVGLRVADEVARAMSEIDWEEQMEALEMLSEFDEERMEELEERLEELEERLEEEEERLEEEYERFGEQYERQIEEAIRQKERVLRAQERELRERLEARSEERQRRFEEQAVRAEALRREAEQRVKEAEERARVREAERRAREEADREAKAADEDDDGGFDTLDV
ncbi:MAG: PDZ domain-containing protein [Thermoanaerobaculia bacterium]|nr:PDZ domain-containing protein [Thermoanaerobaculia bacterium]